MNQNKLETISNLFEGKEIRSVWDSEKEEYYFSVIDVINVLAEPKEPRKYWNDLKRQLIKAVWRLVFIAIYRLVCAKIAWNYGPVVIYLLKIAVPVHHQMYFFLKGKSGA